MAPGDHIKEQDRLFDIVLSNAYNDNGWIIVPEVVSQESKQAAREFADCIAGTEDDHLRAFDWMLIHEALGDIEKARLIGEKDLTRRVKEIRDGEYTEYPRLLVEYIDTIQTSAEFQAQRLWILGRRDDSLDCIKEALDLAKEHNVPLSDGLVDLRDDLMERISEGDLPSPS